MRKFPWLHLLIILLIAATARALLLASGAVSFHSDEAIVALMARHINQGARPVFFYGQAYMGSLDAWLIAIGFRLLGESVASIRLVQSVLYLLIVATGYLAAWEFSGKRIVAAVAGLLLAVPTVNMALYTTATLGGYNETLLFGNLILIAGYKIARGMARSWQWAVLGLATGLGWWTNGLIALNVLPTGLFILWMWLRQRVSIRQVLPGILLLVAAFFIGSAPWWIFDFTHNHAALATYLTNRQSGEFEGIGIPYVPPTQRALGLIVIGLPTLIGMRFPWSSTYFLLPVGVLVALIYVTASLRLLRVDNALKPGARLLVLLIPGVFVTVFIASTFGADPTGRYFLPLVLPLGILLGTLAETLANPPNGKEGASYRLARRALPVLLVGLVLGYQLAGQISAASGDTGLTTQFDPITHISNDHDAEVIAFLEDHNLTHGYTNYWVAFRLAFLSGEKLQYSASLPYKADLSYNAADKRYPPYDEATDAADRVAYITTRLPELDQTLEAAWRTQGIDYQQVMIGDFHIYYDFSSRPTSLTFGTP